MRKPIGGLAAFALICAQDAQAQRGFLLEASGVITSGAHATFEELEQGGRTSALTGYGFQAGALHRWPLRAGAFSTGLRIAHRRSRREVAYDTSAVISPSSLVRVDHAWNGTLTAERIALSIPMQLWLQLSQRSRLILGLEARFALDARVTEQGRLTEVETLYAPSYQVLSVTRSEDRYTRIRKDEAQRALHLAFGAGYRWALRPSVLIGPDVLLVASTKGGRDIIGTVGEGMLTVMVLVSSPRGAVPAQQE